MLDPVLEGLKAGLGKQTVLANSCLDSACSSFQIKYKFDTFSHRHSSYQAVISE